jgi:hypothetical protein
MTTSSARGLSSGRKFQWTPGVILGLLVLGALGYIAAAPGYMAELQMNEGNWFALTDQAVDPAAASPEGTVDASTAQTEGLASASPQQGSRGDRN